MPNCGHPGAECIIGDYWACPICDAEPKEKAPDTYRELPGFATYKLNTCLGEIYCDSEDTFRFLVSNYDELDNVTDEMFDCYELGGTSFFLADLGSVWQVCKFRNGLKGHYKLLIPKKHRPNLHAVTPSATGSNSQQQRTQVNQPGGGYYSGIATLPLQYSPSPAPYSVSVRTLPPPGIGHPRTSSRPRPQYGSVTLDAETLLAAMRNLEARLKV